MFFQNSRMNLFQRLSIVVLFVLYLNLFFFKPMGEVGVGLVGLGLLAFVLMIFWDKLSYIKHIQTIAITTGVALFLLLTIFRVDNNFVLMMSFLSFMFTINVLVYILSARIPFLRSYSELLLSPLRSVGTYFSSFATSIKKLAKVKQQQTMVEVSHKKVDMAWVKSVLVGLLFGVPIAFILLGLFVQADPIFADFIKHINLDFDFSLSIPQRVVLSFIFFVGLFPFVAYKQKADVSSPLKGLNRNAFVVEYSVIMLLVSLVFALFLVVQWPYVFVNVAYETDLSKFGVTTYSEYVRKGFGELLVIAVLAYSLLWGGLIVLKNKLPSTKTLLKPLQMVVMIKFGIFLLSIYRRIYLYQAHHGWSLVRIYGGFLLLWISMITVTLLLRHFYHRRFVVVEAALTAGLVLYLGLFNAEQFIARHHPPTVNGRIDYVYLSRMSADGYDGWMMAYDFASKTLKKYRNTPGLLDKDARRDIAYAGMVTDRLSDTHLLLEQKYGTKAELLVYYGDVIEHMQNNPIRGVYSNQRLSQAMSMVDDDQLTYLSVQPWYRGRVAFVQNTDMYPFYYVSGAGIDEYRLEHWDDRLLTWNLSEYVAHQKIQDDMPLDDLLYLQDSFHGLMMRIREQEPVNQRFDMDISMDAPFLEW